ncbi:MAG: DNA polymerase III subunit gamma/tau [Synergistes jonesii]|uniref:DNA polymerase III subunit gamma/tau n=1 Tax=Synergistes jonesii TaxID=2754 RepID=UPI002A752B39|nr:DNA polymerase III subunit gamma/tau [Synergistes jonesii]MDY2984155.1 DNA polymerase III subunit gamma/tau [Synergistes jonesii]
MYISLYRRYRPQTFSDMVGQSAAVGVLMESLREGALGHAYLFSGPRGCGKTSAARIVAKSLDCLNRRDGCEPCGECANCCAIAAGEHLDVIEIDGASNRGIGEIRDLKSHVSLKPLSASYKVYIIDEVHMLTDAAFNALLKTLEEPPANVVFLLATTEPHKVPVTIRSRCQHIPFHRITTADTVARLKYVCEKENIEAEDEAVWEIARQADGALRDALSLTEQAVALGRGRLSLDAIRELTGGSSRSELERWTVSLRADPQNAASVLHSIMARGISPERLCESLFVLFRDLWLYSLWQERALEALETSVEERGFLASEAKEWEVEKLQAACMVLSRLMPKTRYGMKGDIFSGLVFMELRNIISGSEAQPAPPQGIAQPRKAERAQYAQPASAPKTQLSAPFAGPPAPSTGEKASSLDAAALCARLGDGDFSRLVGNLSSDRLPVASALLNAEIYSADGGLEISFERPCPSQNFLSMERNRKNALRAAARTWGIDIPEVQEAEPEPQMQEAGAPVTAQEEKAADKPAQRQNVQQERQGSALLDADPGISRMLRRAGAEVLYVEKGDSGLEGLSENL